MLGKLFAYEINQTYKPIIIANAILIGSTLLSNLETNLFLWLNVSRDNIFFIISFTLLGFVFVGSIISVAAVCIVFLSLNFYRSMYAERGYLTHTLPVDSGKSFNVKVVVSTLWMFVSTAIIFICFLLRCVNIRKESFSEFFKHIADIYIPQDINISKLFFIGDSAVKTVVIFAVLALLGIVGTFLFFFSAMTIGQLSYKNKKGSAILIGIGLFVIQQLIEIGIILIFLFSQSNDYVDFNTMAGIVNKVAAVSISFYILFMAAEYVIDMFIIRKRLNLQ